MERWRLRDQEIQIDLDEGDDGHRDRYRLSFWPELAARELDPFESDQWEPVWPELRVVHPVRRKRRSHWKQLEFPFDDERRLTEEHYFRQAAGAFRAHLPAGVARAITPIHHGQWDLLNACRSAPRFLDLIRSNRILAVLWLMREPGIIDSATALHRASGTGQRDLLEQLGADGRKSTLKLLKRVPISGFDFTMNRMLRTIITDPAALMRLRHVPRMSRGVVALAEDPELLELCSPALLQEVALAKDEVDGVETAFALMDYLKDCRRLGETPQRFDRRYDVFRCRVQVNWALQDAQERGETLKGDAVVAPNDEPFPEPPLAGRKSIIPIRCPAELRRLGDACGNCLGEPKASEDYIRKIRSGRFYLYQVTWPERGALMIMRVGKNRWQRCELRARGNAFPKPRTRTRINRWLLEEQGS